MNEQGNTQIQEIVKETISKMTSVEKISLCIGLDFWNTKPITRLGIPSILMTDGPHGIRKVNTKGDLGISEPATCFPTASALASSWNTSLICEIGRAIGIEAQNKEIQIVLGPGINIKRSPLCGRNFEYYSEDPYLTSELAIAFILGVQSQGVGTCLKHYVANNQETNRMRINAIIDERSLREIYLYAFEQVLKKAKPWSIMAAYNKLNGEYCSQHKWLLHTILKEEWGFNGIIISDWGAIDDPVKSLKAGLHLQMPSNGGISESKIEKAFSEGLIDDKKLNLCVKQLLYTILKAYKNKSSSVPYDVKKHHNLARKAAAECLVLLKNEDNLLPLLPQKYNKIAVIGPLAKTPYIQGSGSAHVNTIQVDKPYDILKEHAKNIFTINYTQGYSLVGSDIDQAYNDTIKLAEDSDIVLFFAGFNTEYEAEGFDRDHLSLPENQNHLIKELAKVQPNIVVILQAGSAVAMPWLSQAKGILFVGLGGEAVGGAIVDILLGNVNPSGKLAETFPKRIEDTPAILNWPGEKENILYGEGLFIGYRYYEKKKIAPLFPFGFGLSYTTFKYTKMHLNKKVFSEKDRIEVYVSLKNTGPYSGKEVVQLYIGFKAIKGNNPVNNPVKQLKAFQKVRLLPGEEVSITFLLEEEAFLFYDTNKNAWQIQPGEFDVLVGSSSKDIYLNDTINVKSIKTEHPTPDKYSTLGEWLSHPVGKKLINEIVIDIIKFHEANSNKIMDEHERKRIINRISSLPLLKLIHLSQGRITENKVENIVKKVNEINLLQ